MNKVISYTRVSTQKQGRSGLGLEAQQAAIDDYLIRTGAMLIGEYTEVESGKQDERPELERALQRCRLTGATLVIAKLDRLSRNVEFIARMQNSEIDFVCCDLPEANRLTIGILAVMAQHEREMISARTKAALAAAKARGVKLGNPNLAAVANRDTTRASRAYSDQCKKRNRELREITVEIKTEGEKQGRTMSSRALAAALNDAGYLSARGKPINHNQVLRILRDTV